MKVFISSGLWDGVTLDGIGIAVMITMLTLAVTAAVLCNVVPRLAHRWETEYKTRDLTYGAVCLAMSYALSWAELFRLPNGGGVTPAALAPLYVYCYYFGFRKGAAVSAAYMLLQFTQGVYIVSPWSAFFDYILPCFAVCAVGLFHYDPDRYAAFVARSRKAQGGAKGAASRWAHTLGGHWRLFVGAAVHTAMRYASYTVSGVMNFEYWYGAASLAYELGFSLSYNSFALVDGAIAIAAAVLLASSRTFNYYMTAAFANKRAYINASENEAAEEASPKAPDDKTTEKELTSK